MPLSVVVEHVDQDYVALYVQSTESDSLDDRKIDLLFSVRETANGIDFRVSYAGDDRDLPVVLCEGKAPMEVYRR